VDLYNLICDPAFLLVAWDRVRGNKGARTAGVDGRTAYSIEAGQGVEEFLDGLRASLKDRSFRPLPARERKIPKAGGKLRRLGIATVTDRVVQASLKVVLEPIFETDFLPCSYGFRPKRRAHDAVAEVHHFASRSYDRASQMTRSRLRLLPISDRVKDVAIPALRHQITVLECQRLSLDPWTDLAG
jgi:RNA-directed DNA polymerase